MLGNLQDLLEKLPVTLLVLAYLGWLGYGYYEFINDASSPLLTKQHQIAAAQGEIATLRLRIRQVNDFAQSLEVKKLELRSLAEQLDATKANLTESLDIPDLMKTLLVEAKRAGLTMKSLKPLTYKTHDSYGEQDFEFTSSGIYFQYIEFLNNVSNLQRIIDIDNFKFNPDSPADAKYVELKSDIQFKVYRYLDSQADAISKKSGTGGSAPAESRGM